MGLRAAPGLPSGYAAGNLPVMGVRAVFDDREAVQRMNRFNRRLGATEKALDNFAKRSEQSAKRSEAAQGKSVKKQSGGLRRLRWEMVTVVYFMRMMERAVSGAYERMAEAATDRALVRGVEALASVYGQSTARIVGSMQSMSHGTVNTMDLVRAAQSGLLQDQGRFASEYGRLWESARVAMAVAGDDANKTFAALVEGLDEADPKIIDAATSVFRMEDALRRYALQSGRTTDALSDQEARQTMLNEVYARTGELLEAGADEALEQIETNEALKESWRGLTGALVTLADTTGLIEFLTKAFTAGGQAAAVLAGGITIATGQLALFQRLVGGEITSMAQLRSEFLALGEAGDASFKRVSEAMGIIFDDAESLGKVGDRVDDLIDKLLEARMKAAELAGAGLERALDAIAQYQRRSARLAKEHSRRLERMERERNRDIDRINRRYNTQRDRAIRAFNRRVEDMQDEHNSRIQEATERHNIQMRHARERHQLQSLIDEHMYNFERGLLVAEGDVLAIEELDERYRLEQDARERNFRMQQRQAEEMFRMQLKFMKEAQKQQVEALKEALQEQLNEIEMRRKEDIDERKQKHGEQLEEAEESYADQQTALDEGLESQLTAIGRAMQKQAEKWEEGYDTIIDLINQALGPGGRADTIIEGFMARYREITIPIRTYVVTGTYPTGGRGEGARGRRSRGGRYQYGGEFIATHPQTITVGERGVPERVTVTPLQPMGGAMSVGWSGGPIQVHGTGEMGGMDLSGIGDAIAEGIVSTMQSSVLGMRGQYGN